MPHLHVQEEERETLSFSCPIPNSQGPIAAVGPLDADILFVGEAGGYTEGREKVPFVGEAGHELNRLLQLAGIDREECRIGNTVNCSPPNDWLVNAPWESAALRHCEPALDSLLAERHKVVVPLGGTALRAVLKLPRQRGKEPAKVQDFHGAPIWDNRGFWVCPTFHPSFNSRSARKFTHCMHFDLRVAKELAAGAWVADEPELVIDPPPGWFQAWVESYLASEGTLLAVDIETPDKSRKSDESELGKEDKSYQILYCNFACGPAQGITVPWVEPYVTMARRLIEGGGPLVFHNANYDVRRLRATGIRINQERVHDSMDAWHVLYSSLPRGLGFVAPFFSKRGPWKHLGSLDGTYRALDGVQTWRVMTGCLAELERERLLEVYLRHMHAYDVYVLKPAEEEGLGLSKPRLLEFSSRMKEVCDGIDAEVQTLVPPEIFDHPLLNEGPYVTEVDGWTDRREESSMVQACGTCGAEQVTKKHRCEDRSLTPSVTLVERVVPRYYRRLAFNAASPEQVRAVILAKGHKPGKDRKTKKDTTDKKTLKRLVKTGDPLYSLLLERRSAGKMGGTYGEGMLERLDILDRVHGTASHVPSTFRLSWVDPNLQNVASHVKYASEFRRAVISRPGTRLMSFDYSGIEAVQVGYFSGDPSYIRLAKLGVHAYVESHMLYHIMKKKIPEPADLRWSDCDLKAHFKEIKARFEVEYDQAKRTVHGYNYGLTEYGLSEQFPELFPKRSMAKQLIDLYTAVCPKLAPWQAQVRELAHRQKYLGGPGAHPFSYKHWFFSVLNYRKVKGIWNEYLGDDAKKSVAFYPQSTAAGTICEAALALLEPGGPNFIGDCGPEGRTPLRAIIHDDLTFEVRDEMADYLRQAVTLEMTRGIEEMPMPTEWGLGDYLTVGVAAKEGMNWAPWDSERNPDGMRGLEDLAADGWQEEDDDEEEVG